MTKKEKAKLFVEISGYNKSFEKQKDFAIESITKVATESEREILTDFYANVDFERPVNETIKIVSEVFSDEELDLAIEFFQSDFGKVYVSKQTEVQSKAQEFAAEWQKELQTKLMADLFKKMLSDKISGLGLGSLPEDIM